MDVAICGTPCELRYDAGTRSGRRRLTRDAGPLRATPVRRRGGATRASPARHPPPDVGGGGTSSAALYRLPGFHSSQLCTPLAYPACIWARTSAGP
jgi:hypothetical protein